MSNFNKILLSLLKQIENGQEDNKILGLYMEKLHIKYLSDDLIDKLIIKIINHCMLHKNDKAAIECLNIWADNLTIYLPMSDIEVEGTNEKNYKTLYEKSIDGDIKILHKGNPKPTPLNELNPVAELFFSNYVNFEILQYVKNLTDETFETLINYIINEKNIPKTSIACVKILKLYNPSRVYNSIYDLLDRLEHLALEKKNYFVSDFIFEVKKEHTSFIEKPSWLIETEKTDEQLYKERKNIINQMLEKDSSSSYNELFDKDIDNILDYFDITGILVDDEQNVTSMLNNVSKTTKLIYLYLVKEENEFQDILSSEPEEYSKIEKYLGPRNMFNNDDFSQSEIKQKIYSEYMMTCNIYEDNDDYDGQFVRNYDWFTGNCSYCGKKIPYRQYCVRKPHKWGGWKGCYCSWDCVLNDVLELDEYTNDNGLTQILVKYFSEKLNATGIYFGNTNPSSKTERVSPKTY